MRNAFQHTLQAAQSSEQKDLEVQVRPWVKVFGRAYVVSGPILNKPANEYSSIENNNVAIPEYFYKVILVPLYEDMADSSTPDDAKAVAAIGFVIPNQDCKDSFWNYTESIDKIERMTNLDFYSLLHYQIHGKIKLKPNIILMIGNSRPRKYIIICCMRSKKNNIQG